MRQVLPSRPALVYSFSLPRLNLVTTHGITPDFRGGVQVLTPLTAVVPVPTLSDYVIRTDDYACCREYTGTGPVVLKVVPVTGAAFPGINIDQLICISLFLRPLLLVCSGHVRYRSTGGCLVVVWVICS